MPSGAAASMSASRRRLSSRSSGALSCTNVRARRAAAARSGSKVSRDRSAPSDQPELGQRRPGRVDEVTQPVLGARGGVPGDHVVAAGEEVGHPAAADDAGADTGDGADVLDRRGSGSVIKPAA